MGLLSNQRPDAAHAPKEVARTLETLLLQRMLQSSGAFKASGAAGAQMHSDLFVETLAEAVANSGAVGLTHQLETALTPAGAPQPAQAGRVTSSFGRRADPIDGHAAIHDGVDVAAPEGTPIVATGAGVVKHAGERGGYGLAVEVDHGNGVTTLYAHASELLVKEGDTVAAGQPLGKVGDTGRSTGAHLHFELRSKRHAIDPGNLAKEALRAYTAAPARDGT